mgnify:CR=1 FL=1
MAANFDPKTQALKLVVIVLGVLIVICLAIVVVTIYNRASEMAAPSENWGPVSIDLPEPCAVAGVSEGGGRLYLAIVAAGDDPRCPLVLILDASTGETVGRIDR